MTRHTSIILGLALVAACDEGFDPPSQLTKLRVLALRAEPVNPALDETTVIEPLVYFPDGDGGAATYAWSWCPTPGQADDGYVCPFTDADVAALADELGIDPPPPPLVLGTERTQAFENVFPAALLAGICETGFGGVLPDCDGGFAIQLAVSVTDGGETVRAVTTVRLPIDDAPSNVNPSLDGLAAVIGGVEAPIDEAATTSIPRRRETELRAPFGEDQAEEYLAPGEDGEPAPQRERIYLSWFSEAAKIDERRTSFIDGETTVEQAAANAWIPEGSNDYESDVSRIVVVIRDNRGGIGWLTGAVTLEGTP